MSRSDCFASSPPPPWSTFFPYTTLFRSGMLVLALVWWAWAAFVWAANAQDTASPTLRLALLLEMVLVFVDRKSTRLNSSHPSISYAVFCLKKKTDRASGSVLTFRWGEYP